MDTLYKTLDDIHAKVRVRFKYVTDQEQYGTEEKWVMPSAAYNGSTRIVGDCEDFALACRKLCRDAGLKTRLIFCMLQGGGHCVLECEGWIFCNNQDRVMSRDDLHRDGYQWMYISGYNPGDAWHEITG